MIGLEKIAIVVLVVVLILGLYVKNIVNTQEASANVELEKTLRDIRNLEEDINNLESSINEKTNIEVIDQYLTENGYNHDSDVTAYIGK